MPNSTVSRKRDKWRLFAAAAITGLATGAKLKYTLLPNERSALVRRALINMKH